MYTLADMRTWLGKRVALTSDATLVTGWQDAAVAEMIDACWWRIQRVAWMDFTLTATMQRFTIPAEDVTILPPAMQIAPDGLPVSTTGYILFGDVVWRQDTPDRVITEVNVDVAGAITTTPAATIVATTPPGLITGKTTTKLRVWFQCRVPQPDYTVPASPVYVPEQFARIATLGYYLGILSDNQSGGDMRQWRKKSEEYLQQAGVLYMQSVPIGMQPQMQADDWLLTGRV